MDYKVYWLLDKLEIQEYDESGDKVDGQVYETEMDQRTDEGYILEPFDTEFGDIHVEVVAEHIKGNWSNGQGPLCSSTTARLKDETGEVIANNKYNTCLVQETHYARDGHDLTSCPITGEWRRKKTCNFNQPLEITEEFKDYIEDSQ